MDAAYLKWRGTELEMLNPEPSLENGPPSGVSGLMIMVFEGPLPEPNSSDSREGVSTVKTISQVIILNNRDLSLP